MYKKSGFILIALFSYIILDFIILPKFTHLGFQPGYQEFQEQRFRVPYIEFTGKPNVDITHEIDVMAPDKRLKFDWHIQHNEMGYLGKSIKDIPDGCITILFFAGSTGYYGNPPIPELLEKNLRKKLNTNNICVVNASVSSSNHNQHVHALVEQFINYPADIVIFYGGFNENIQPLSYDPRPGFPYNYFYINDCPRWRLNLVKYSALLGEMEKRYGFITGIRKFRKNYIADEQKWLNDIGTNYFNTLEKAKKITENSIHSVSFNRPSFIGIYQPYIVPAMYQNTHSKIRSELNKAGYLYDFSDSLNSMDEKIVKFYDNIHVSQEVNEFIASIIADICTKTIEYKRNEGVDSN